MSDDKLNQARAIVKQFYPEMPADYSGRRVQIVIAAFAATDTQVSKLVSAGHIVWNNVLNGDIEATTEQAATSLSLLKIALADMGSEQ